MTEAQVLQRPMLPLKRPAMLNSYTPILISP